MKKITSLLFFFCLFFTKSYSQFPWNNPLMIASSSDGITFNTPAIFQDSSGVPSVIKWKGDTLVAVFQWFRAPNPSPTWDRVAVKFSYDNGINWTQPTPIIVNGIPSGYQRPFDPTLVVINSDSIRIYYSSSDGMPIGLDSTVNTYSAISTDGINFTFETGARVDNLNSRVIDPAVIFFNNTFHYISPIGAPQQGAYHYISPDGINFSAVQSIPSDNNHNWTGNYMIENNAELRFYGCGQNIWFKSTANGGMWNAYINTNIQGGDPSVVKTGTNSYLLIYVGPPNSTGVESLSTNNFFPIYPNPASEKFTICLREFSTCADYTIFNSVGQEVQSGKITSQNEEINCRELSSGIYTLMYRDETSMFVKKLMIRK